MPIQYVNTGSSPNKGDGDSLRTAFTKINYNFGQLITLLGSTVTDVTTIASDETIRLLSHNQHSGVVVQYDSGLDKITVTRLPEFDQELNTTDSPTFSGLSVTNTATFGGDISVGGMIKVGILQGYDDFSIIKDDPNGLHLRLRNTFDFGSSSLELLNSYNGGLVVLHQNPNISGDYLSNNNYIYGMLPQNTLNIGRYSDINFYADAAAYGVPGAILNSTASIRIVSTTGNVLINKPLTVADTTATGQISFGTDQYNGKIERTHTAQVGYIFDFPTSYNGSTPALTGGDYVYLPVTTSSQLIAPGWTLTFANGHQELVESTEYIDFGGGIQVQAVRWLAGLDLPGVDVWPVVATSADYVEVVRDIIITPDLEVPNVKWTFSRTGALVFPDGTEQYTAGGGGTGTNVNLLSVTSSIIPNNNLDHDLGSDSKRWENLYLGPNGITIGTNSLSVDGAGNITVNGSPFEIAIASTSSLVNGSLRVNLDSVGSLNFPPGGIIQSYISSSTTATIILISDIVLGSPVVVYTSSTHNLSNSDLLKFSGIKTTIELNDKYHYASVVSATSVALYEDYALTIPVNGAGYTPYVDVSNLETFANTGTTGRSNVISQLLGVYPDMANIRINWYASGPGIDQPDANNTTYSVIKQPGFLNYLVNGDVNKPLYLQRGNTYYLDVIAPAHPVYIQTTGDGYNPADVYSLGVVNNGTGNGIITFNVPSNAPDVLYYQCQHHIGMGGPIYISDGLGTSKILAINTQTTSSGILYQFILDNTYPLVSQGTYTFTGTIVGAGQLEFQDVEARLTIKSNDQEWVFNPDGLLVIPNNGDIQRNGLSVLSTLVGRTIAVTESLDGSKYLFDGNPDTTPLILIRGLTYYFEANIPGHPFWLQTVPGAYSVNAVYDSGVINNGVEVGTLTFTVPKDAPDTLYYACEYHPGMTGQMSIKNIGDEIDLTNVRSNIIPSTQYTYDLGTTSTHWRNLYARTGFFGNMPTWTVVNPLSVFTSEVDGYSQLQIQNQSTGTSASTDFVATADSGDDTNDYIDLGINGSNYSNPDWTVSGARDGYLYVAGNNLTVGTNSTGTTVKIHVGGTLAENVVATFNEAGTTSTNTITGALTVAGGLGVGGSIVSYDHIPAANNIYDLGSPTHQWRHIYVNTGSIYLGNIKLTTQDNQLNIQQVTEVEGDEVVVQNVALNAVSIDDQAPDNRDGGLWFNTVDGRMYVSYNGQWIDASPTIVPAPETYLGNITIDDDTININGGTLTIENGTLLVNGAEVTGSGANITHMEYTDPVTTYTSTLDLDYNFHVDLDKSHVTFNGAGDWNIGSNYHSTKIYSTNQLGSDPLDIVIRADGNDWQFDRNGVLTLPQGGSVLESTYLGADSIRLKPNGGNPSQFLEIAPTFVDGDHIHLMAGSGTELYLGNDFQYVKLVNNGDVAVRADDTTSSNALWTFGTDGVLTLSTASTILGNSEDPNVYIETVSTTTTSTWTFGIDGVLTLPETTPIIKGGGTGTDVTIIASDGTSTTSTWVFKDNGVTELPGGLKIDLISNYAPVNGTIITQESGNWLQLASTGTGGNTIVGWSEYLTEPGGYATIQFNPLDSWGVSITAGSFTTTVHSWVFDQGGTLTLPGLMTLPITASTPAITTASGTVAVCDGTGWDGGGDGLQHLMIYLNNTWTVVV